MNIAVVDNGIMEGLVVKSATVVSNISFVYNLRSQKIEKRDGYSTGSNHGTLVVNTIEKYSKTKNYYHIYNVFNENGISSGYSVLEALRHINACDNIEMVVMCLTVDEKFLPLYNDILKELFDKGIKIIASSSNAGESSALTESKYVICVDAMFPKYSHTYYIKKHKNIVLADSNFEFVKMGNDQPALFYGTSKGTACFAGFMTNFSKSKIKNIKKSNELKKMILYKGGKISHNSLFEIYNEIYEIIDDCEAFSYDEIEENTKISELIPETNQIAGILNYFSRKYNFTYDITFIPSEMFFTLAGIYNFIEFFIEKGSSDKFKNRISKFVNRYNLKLICKETLKYFKYNFITIVFSLLSSALLYFSPIAEQNIIDLGILQSNIGSLALWIGILICVIIVQQFVGIANTIAAIKINNKIEIDLKSRFVEKITSVKLNSFFDNDSGKIDSLIKNDLVEFKSIITTSILTFVTSTFELIFSCFMMLKYNIYLGIVILLFEIASVFLVTHQFDNLELNGTKLRNVHIQQNRVLNDIIYNIRVLRLVGAKDFLLKKLSAAMNAKGKQLEKTTFFNLKISSYNDILSNITTGLIYFLGGILIIKGQMTLGMLIGFMQYAGKFSAPVSSIISEISSYRENVACITDVADFLNDRKYRYQNQGETIANFSEITSVEMKNICFSYDSENNIFENANALFLTQKINYIIGKTGSGKSTLTKILLGGYNVQKGSVLINGVDIKDIDSYEDLISYVPQDSIIFHDTIFNNLTLGKNVDKEYLESVCKKCCIFEDIMSLEMGFATMMNESGNNFSGGQKQRISLARAIIQNKPIIILDECTSAIDSLTEALIRENIREFLEERLSIVITHSNNFIASDSRVFEVNDKIIKAKNVKYIFK